MTEGGDIARLQSWFEPRLNQFSEDSVLVDKLKEDILNNYVTIHLEDGGPQAYFLRKHCKQGSWVRMRDLEIEYKGRPGSTVEELPEFNERILKISGRSHINKVLPYFRYF